MVIVFFVLGVEVIMANVDVLLPRMGESIQEGTITKWHKKVGDRIEREEVLFEVSTDKVDTEVPSPASGVVTKIVAAEGQTVAVDSLVAVIDTAATAGAAASAPAQVEKATQPPAPPAAAAPKAASAPVAPAQTEARVERAPGERQLSSPLVRKMAEEHNINLGNVQGSGESGRITKTDLLSYLQQGNKVPSLVAAAAENVISPVKSAPTAHIEATGGEAGGLVDGLRVERKPMTPMRKKIAEHMVMSKRTSPHVTSVIEIDLQKIVDLRDKFKGKFEQQHGFKLSFMPFFMMAALEGIKAVPIVNASVDGDTVIYKKDVNLGIAVALDWGLIVPVIKNAGERSFVGLGRELNTLAEKARNKKLAPDDVKGGSFSITNFGGFGTVIGQPIINQPQVAIMGMGAMVKKPVVINDAIAIRTCCYFVLSFDHRVIDGSDSGKFLSTMKNFLENWTLPVL